MRRANLLLAIGVVCVAINGTIFAFDPSRPVFAVAFAVTLVALVVNYHFWNAQRRWR